MTQTKRIKRRKKIAHLEGEARYLPGKRQVCLRLDADVLAWLQRGGRGYQTRINQALRKIMDEGELPEATRTPVAKSSKLAGPRL